MCQLKFAIDNLLESINQDNAIEEINDLNYKWENSDTAWNENDIYDYFWILRGELLDALKANRLVDDINLKLICVIQKIVQDFGDINSLSFDTYKTYQYLLRRLYENGDGTTVFEYDIPNDNKRIRVDPACPVCYSYFNTETGNWNNNDSSVVTPLSTWTKVLAAYDPTRFWIYDARVALALMFLSKTNESLSYDWFMPSPGSRHIRNLAKKINGGSFINSPQADAEESYRRYLALLLSQEENRESAYKIVKTASLFEKRLFMLGGKIRDRYKDDKQANAILAIAGVNVMN